MKARRLIILSSVPLFVLSFAPAVAAAPCLLQILCPSVPPPPPAPAPPPILQPVDDTVNSITKTSAPSLEAIMLTKVNAERALAGVGPLQVNSWAHSVARGHSEKMAVAGSIWHNPAYMANGRKAMGANALGENVGMDVSIGGAHSALMASPSHRVNIVDGRFTHVGIGVAVKGLQIFVTQDFAGIAGSGAAPAAAAKAPGAGGTRPSGADGTAIAPVVNMTASGSGNLSTIVLGASDGKGDRVTDSSGRLASAGERPLSTSGGPAAQTGAIAGLLTCIALLTRRAVVVMGLG